ncbi:MAG: hypothetical protein M1827_004431 [Pycnora praestabilis]|nr:MAG: hypothetical protein M1827_004431 [Pycnora praestabilis]
MPFSDLTQPNGNGSSHTLNEDAHQANNSSQASLNSQTASEFINSQLQLEADAREALPYAFDTCTQPLGPLRQILFSCLTCNPPPASATEPYNPAGVCYSCSIACHGEHTLVELFNKRNFVCDCGTSRIPETSPCTLRINPATGSKGGGHSETPAAENEYNQNFRNRFCGCGRYYDAYREKGTMYQCLGLGTVVGGGCGEDWWHPGCIVGLDPDWHEKSICKAVPDVPTNGECAPSAVDRGKPNGNHDGISEDGDPPPPAGFPNENDFEAFICYKCVEANPWIKRYAGTSGFLPPVYYQTTLSTIEEVKVEAREMSSAAISSTLLETPIGTQHSTSKKRKADNEEISPPSSPKHFKSASQETTPSPSCHYKTLPSAPSKLLSLFVKEDFRDHLCRCPDCFPDLAKHQQLLEEEDSYEPPLSESGEGDAGASIGTGSLLDRGEAALSNVDRVRAIEGVMVYNHLKDKVKTFLQPFAESGQAVGAEDIKAYFEKLRGDAEAIKAAGGAAVGGGADGDGDGRREQSGY